ncbi:hypothetical protein ACLKA6_018370 [Drosophila palustris]
MKASKLDAHLNNPTLLQELIEKMGSDMMLNWAIHSKSVSCPNLQDLADWLFELAEAACRVSTPNIAPIANKGGTRRASLNTHAAARGEDQPRAQCILCEEAHCLTACVAFKRMPVVARLEVVKNNQICAQCLKRHKGSCWTKRCCTVNGCNERHSSLLHVDQEAPTTSVLHSHRKTSSSTTETFFRIVPVTLHGKSKSIDVYAFMDDGSTLTLMEESVANELDERGTASPLCIAWTGEVRRNEPQSRRLNLKISKQCQGAKVFQLKDVHTVKSLGMSAETMEAEKTKMLYPHLKGLPLPSYVKVVPQIIIGVNNPNLISSLKIREGKWQQPIAAKTRLGWTVYGGSRRSEGRLHLHKCQCDQDLHELVKRNMLSENSVTQKATTTPEEKRAVQILENTISCDADKYTVGLLWKEDNRQFPDSLPTAMKRLTCLRRKMASDAKLATELYKQIDNLIDKGYAKKLSDSAMVTSTKDWCSNSKEVLSALDEATSPNEKKFYNSEELHSHEKILGMQWNPNQDAFTYALKFVRLKRNIIASNTVPTKREVLQVLMSVFDPMGFVSCIMMYLKILLQNIWRTQINWDEKLTPELQDMWRTWLSFLPVIAEVKIPRCYFKHQRAEDVQLQLHVFVDAGEDAYAAVAYFRIEHEAWPEKNNSKIEATEELRPRFLHMREDVTRPNCEYYSNWTRLSRAVAYWHLYKEKLLNKIRKTSEATRLHVEHIANAQRFIYRAIQLEYFADEYAATTKGQSVCRSSPLWRLQLFIDDYGVMCVRNRARGYTSINEDLVALSPEHWATKLIVRSYHEKYFHINHETTINEVRQKFSIAKLRPLLKGIRRNCQHCKLQNAQPVPPLMAPLPRARLGAFMPAFTYVGVDYFGPLTVIDGRKALKRWGMLITCLTMRAISIEIVHSLSTNSCLMGLRRHIARRGTPKEIYSDNGTNFRGTDAFLRENMQLDDSEMHQNLMQRGISWYFNPPAAPHMGGAWERLVRSIKTVLYRVVPNQKFTDESLLTAMMEVEMTVNSRPLTFVSLDHEDQEAITPNHLLLGSSNGEKPFCPAEEIDYKWTLRQSEMFANQFWNRWVKEMLPNITRRNKWHQKVKPIAVGDIVLIVDENQRRNTWTKGRVIEVTTAEDGQVRRAKIQTSNGVLTRPAVKLAVLDVGN